MHLNLSSFLQWKVNILLYRKLGWRLAFVYIMILGKLYFFLKPEEKGQIKKAVKIAFGDQKNRSELKVITRKIYHGILQHYFEKLFNVYSPIGRLKNFFDWYIETEGKAAIDQGIAKRKGVLLITGHYGGIEYIPKYLAVQNYPVTILAKFSSDQLRNISTEQASHLAINLIDAKNCRNIIKAIMENLRENRIVITMCDEIEEWRPSVHEEVFFLGKRINLDKTLNTLLRRTDTSVIFAVMQRADKGRYKFVTHSWDDISEAIVEASQKTVGERVLKLLEQYIYNNPEEWYQWKNFPTVDEIKSRSIPADGINSSSWLKPAFEKIQ